MTASQTTKIEATKGASVPSPLEDFLPDELRALSNPQTDLPRIAKDDKLIRRIESAIQQVPTTHTLLRGDARTMANLRRRAFTLS